MASDDIVKQVADRVRELVDEAEQRATEIVREAEQEAQRIRSRAETEARERLDEVRSALDRLQGKLSGAGGAEVEPGPATVPEPEPPATPEPEPPPVPEPEPEPVPEPEPPPDEATPPSPEPPAPSDDGAAVRLVAMKLALDGTSRDEARAKLAAEYSVADLDALLDDVYAKAGR